MKTLKKITCLTTILCLTASAWAQHHKGDRKAHKEKIQAMKVGYLTEKLDLSPSEAQSFWPVYNEYNAKMETIHREIRKTHRNDLSIDEMTDTAVEDMVNLHHQLRQKELNTQNEYLLKFKEIISIKKIAKLYKSEHDFKRELLKKLKVSKGGSNALNIPPPPPEQRH
jgi:hypothetical protein